MRFIGNLLQQVLVGHVLEKHRFYLLGPQLTHQFCHAHGRGFGIGTDSLRSHEVDLIAITQIAKGIMRSHHFSPCRRHGSELGLRPLIQRFSAAGQGLRTLMVYRCPRRIRLDQAVFDITDLALQADRVMPGMRINFGFPGFTDRCYATCSNDGGTTEPC
jgi:hypothetical protein